MALLMPELGVDLYRTWHIERDDVGPNALLPVFSLDITHRHQMRRLLVSDFKTT